MHRLSPWGAAIVAGIGGIQTQPFDGSDHTSTSALSSTVSSTITRSSSIPTTTSQYNTSPSSTTEPCALIHKAWHDGYTTFDADTAYACLQSVPLDKEGGLSQIRGLSVLYQWQSDLSFLKDPPPGFLYPAVDVLQELDDISSALSADAYSNEYDFQVDLFELVTSVYNFHTNYPVDIVNVFGWGRESGLVSFSSDGLALPNLYSTDDLDSLTGLRTDYTASPVVGINGAVAEDWVNAYAALNPWDHDPDANYNYVLFNVPNTIQGQGETLLPTFNSTQNYQGNSTALTFANGTQSLVATFAILNEGDFSNVTDGASFFAKFCSGTDSSDSGDDSAAAVASQTTSSRSHTRTATTTSYYSSASYSDPPETENAYTAVPTQTANPGPAFYPWPVVIASDSSISGYFPDEQDDLAVLVIPTMEPEDDYEFQDIFRSFLATSKAQGKTRLIIDVRGNGGGTVLDGYDLFKQLFPSIVPYGGMNLAASPLANAVGVAVTDGVTGGNLSEADLTIGEFDVQEDLNINLKDYDTWQDFFGPQVIHGGNYTNLERYNLSDPNALGGSPIYGYGDDTQPQPQTFDSSNITILSDALCGSTCAIFAELIKTQGGVQAIAVGGRSSYGPMQWVGGSKGTLVVTMEVLSNMVNASYETATPDVQKLFEPYVPFFGDVEQALSRLSSPESGRVNFKNNIRVGDQTQTPLHYVYEAADCRFFYTPDMFYQQSLVWDRTYKIMWEGGYCVSGSASPASSLSGSSSGNNSGDIYINSPPPASVNFTLPANATFSYPFNVPKPTSSSS